MDKIEETCHVGVWSDALKCRVSCGQKVEFIGIASFAEAEGKTNTIKCGLCREHAKKEDVEIGYWNEIVKVKSFPFPLHAKARDIM